MHDEEQETYTHTNTLAQNNNHTFNIRSQKNGSVRKRKCEQLAFHLDGIYNLNVCLHVYTQRCHTIYVCIDLMVDLAVECVHVTPLKAAHSMRAYLYVCFVTVCGVKKE